MGKNQPPYSAILLAAVIALLFFFKAGPIAANDPSVPFPGVVSGILDLTDHDLYLNGNIQLDGKWQFFQGVTLSPAVFLKTDPPEPDGFYPVPEYWTSYPDLSLLPEGEATYRLRVHIMKKDRPVSLSIPEIFTEYRLFVNGHLMDSHGRFSDGKIRFLSPRIYTFYNNQDTIEILLNIANQNHANAGIGQSFFLGSPENIHKQYRLNTIIEMILVAVCLFAGIYHCILFSLRKKERELLFFGLFCMLLTIRTLLTGTTFITQVIPDLSFEAGSRAATAVIPLCVMAFQTYAFYFFKPGFPVTAHRLLLGLHGLYLIAPLTLSPMIYSTLFTPYLMLTMVTCLFLMIVNIRSVMNRHPYAVIFLAGFVFVFAGVVNDTLHYMQIINTGYLLSLWFSFFIIAQSVMLAIKFANEHKMVEALSLRLQISDRLKDEFLANTSHELRTPLNGIIGICDSLIDGIAGSLPGRARANLKLISSSARRLASLIDDILDYARLKTRDITLSLKNIDLRQITEVVLTILKATAPSRNVELINDVSSDFPTVRGDEKRLQQILFNLIGNGIKFTEKGTVRVFAEDKGSVVMVHIQDTGKGIPAHKLNDIFHSFEQVDGTPVRNHGGTGLGLPITRKLVELQGGTIQVQSVENQGATFSFTLQKSLAGKKPDTPPIIPWETRDMPAEKNQITHHPGGTGENILIVDDEITNIRVLENFLYLENYRFDHATHGIQALEMLEDQEFDLVLLDIMMPRMSGYEVLNHIRKTRTAYELPVLMLTAGKQNREMVAAFHAGANDYLTKPIDRLELIARIKTQLSLSHAVDTALKNVTLANTDELTGLYNRRFMIHSGNREFTSTRVLNKPLSVIMLDIDFFKAINDRHGHAAGDRILQDLADIIKKNIRGIDVAVRYGGEEFVIILPGTTSKGAAQAAEKIRQIVEKSRVPASDNQIMTYTVSFGVASVHDPASCFDDLLKEADRMLYQSKKTGRNKVTVSPRQPQRQPHGFNRKTDKIVMADQ
ncbi:MAG: diguanylate cyclase [Desulfotignum sp.]|nr:diguanylate cyclase [Desulfotignum sp.]MCF8137548.1 diguanylate cyclase [Desulfotignum sp.]